MQEIKLGVILEAQWDKSICRVIGFDEYEVFYDAFWEHDSSWTFSGNFKKKCFFYRTSKEAFKTKTKYIDYLPLTEIEINVFRPDLPMRICRSKELSWNNFNSSSDKEIVKKIQELHNEEFLKNIINTNELILIPSGNKGGLKKGIYIKAENQKYFDSIELILKAKKIQEEVNTEISDGIGIYRLGFEKGIPSYYIDKFKNAAEY